MKRATKGSISLVLSLFPVAMTLVILLVLSTGTNQIVIALLIIWPVSYFFFRLVLHLFLYSKLENLYVRLISSGKAKAYRKKSKNLKAFHIELIEEEVNSLMKEKTKEIDQLKELESFRKEFLGNVAHELRTPMFSVQGYVHTLLDGAMDDPSVRQKFLAKAAKNIDDLSNMVEDLMTISSIQSKKLKIHKQVFELRDIIREVFESLHFIAMERNIRFILKGTEETRNFVIADEQKIKQVMTNLLTNSVKYGKQDGQTTVGLFDMKDHVLIEVADNGEGISAEHLPRIFERFYRVDKNRSRIKGGSTGLGLSIVKHFIEAHGQKISVRSSVGTGTVFSFTLEKPAKED